MLTPRQYRAMPPEKPVADFMVYVQPDGRGALVPTSYHGYDWMVEQGLTDDTPEEEVQRKGLGVMLEPDDLRHYLSIMDGRRVKALLSPCDPALLSYDEKRRCNAAVIKLSDDLGNVVNLPPDTFQEKTRFN